GLDVHGELERVDGQRDASRVGPAQARVTRALRQAEPGNAETQEPLARPVVHGDRRLPVMAGPERNPVGLERRRARRLLEHPDSCSGHPAELWTWHDPLGDGPCGVPARDEGERDGESDEATADAHGDLRVTRRWHNWKR